MNNIVGTYLMFKANNICAYIDVLAEKLRKVSKIPKQLNKLIYKYYDLFILSDKDINYDLLKMKTGLNEDGSRLILFYLLIEFDMASKTEYKRREYYEFYNLIVNLIIVFCEIENYQIFNRNISYDDVMSKVLKNNIDKLDNSFILLFDECYDGLKKIYNLSVKKERKFYELYNSSIYSVNYTKIKGSCEFYLEKFRYKNNKLLEESKKDVLLIASEYESKLNLVNIEMVSVRVMKDTMSGIKRTVFVRLDDEIITKKINLEVLIDMFKLRFLKERIVLLVNTSVLEKYEERINNLILDDFKVSYYKDSNLSSYDVYKNGGYLFIDYADMNNGVDFSKKYNLELIVDNVSKKNAENLNNIKFVT